MELPFAGAAVRASYGGMVRALAEAQRLSRSQSIPSEGSTNDWIPLYCEALAAYGDAIRAEPQQARLLMQWANLRQILGSTACPAPYTAGDYKEALLKALEIDPTNTDAQYAAGLIFRWGGDIDTASQLFNSVLRYHPSLSTNQERQIYASIDSAERLTRIVPARFPQVLKASRYFLADPGAVSTVAVREPAFLASIEMLQLGALKESHEAYTAGLLPFSMHLQRLDALTDVAATTQIRQELDRRLAVLLVRAGDAGLAHYLEERQRLYELEVIPSSIAGDTRPLKSSLVEWGGAGSYFADEFYQSVGFFLAPQQGVRAVELRFGARPSQAFRNALRVYVSSDNRNWSEIEQRGAPQVFGLGSKHFVVLRVPTRGEPYWKVHFANASRERKLLTSLSEGLRVYGLSARQVPREASPS
jgi:tetratricopeptide (TPR) repeat protein